MYASDNNPIKTNAQSQSMYNKANVKMNLSFAGCGFLGIYHVGVACCFRKYAPHLLLNEISGASIGAIAACSLLCDIPLGDVTSDMLKVATDARSRSLGPFNPSFNIQNLLLEGLQKVLPEDAHIRVNGKLHISLTRVCDGKNVIVSNFESREDLMHALLCSAFIPFFSGIIPPKFHGVRYMDGGFSDNLPTLDENTITVSPFCGESDICPRDDSSQLFHINIANTSIELSKHNIYRIGRILFPPKPEVLANMCKQGFDDALRFLHRNNLISCTRCLAVQSTFVVSESVEENYEYDPQCHECNKHRQEALVSNMPETVVTIFQEAIDKANKGLVNWVFRHRGMKLLSILALPYTLPADVMYATITNVVGGTIETRSLQYRVIGNGIMTSKRHFHFITNSRLLSTAPLMGSTLWQVSSYFMSQVTNIVNKVNTKRQQLSAKIICQLNITEYGGDKYDVESCPDPHLSTHNKMNLNFTLDLEDSDLPLEQSSKKQFSTGKILSKRPSVQFIRTDTADHDTFDHILQVTAQHEAIMAYYYMDDNNKVKLTEIFDVTDCDSPAVQTNQEKETNMHLEFDDEWGKSTWTTEVVEDDRCSYEGSSVYSLEDLLERDTSNLFSDPESEWNVTYKVEEPEDDIQLTDLRPESDQEQKLKV